MGVTGLWTVVQPCARPIKIETLNKKRLAVDASIWIYQFLKAVRDKEGSALRNSHVVGFFRRICKLLFIGIKPVFVFDGGAPALKRQTISARKSRREGRRDDAVRTAGKLLALQMQRRAEEEEHKRKEEAERGRQEEEEVPEEGLVYVDELQMTQQERQQNRKFKKKDAYHLPELDVSMSEMGGPNDPRIMSLEELEAYAQQFQSGEDMINVYDFSKIDYDSPFFMSLPASDRYNILNAARLRSRLRMGHSKEQLDSMFPDRMAFSKFQIERVTERNELTQRLMHINGPNDDAMFGINGTGRVAGEKGREYVLVKNDGVEGGWALGVVSNKDEGTASKPVDVESPKAVKEESENSEDDEDFEDVPVEGLNRLPRRPIKPSGADDEAVAQRRALYDDTRRRAVRKRATAKQSDDPNSLFVADERVEDEEGWEDVGQDGELFGDAYSDAEDEELNRAIALSMQKDHHSDDEETRQAIAMSLDKSDDEGNAQEDLLKAFQQKRATEAMPLPKGSGRAIASIVNKRAHKDAPESREVTSFGVPLPKADESEDEETMDFQAALAESRKSKRKPSSPRRPAAKPVEQTEAAKQGGFSGPLPFEKLDLGSSLLGKKKMQQRTEEASGGFFNEALGERKKDGPELPPWFAGDIEDDMKAQREIELADRKRQREFDKQFRFDSVDRPTLRQERTGEVIDLDAEDDDRQARKEIIDLEAEDQDEAVEKDFAMQDSELRMGDMADAVRIEPPSPAKDYRKASPPPAQVPGPFQDYEESDNEAEAVDAGATDAPSPVKEDSTTRPVATQEIAAEDEEMIEWSDSDDGQANPDKSPSQQPAQPAGGTLRPEASKSPSMEFENIGILDEPQPPQGRVDINESPSVVDGDGIVPASGTANQSAPADDFDDFEDSEDEELMRQLAVEAEEHARFASSLNHKPQSQNIEDYERELKQLRSQQKKDRRDADEVTHIMITECQQLLRLFGLPYITAPMEAEAQCAELVSLGLVDGIVTDDSDCFLFGGTRIYKNMFNQAKFVECYLTSDLEKEFDLTRQKLIRIAHLLGSDYTEGLPGVGPVTALEILSEFPTLEEFKDWWGGVQMNTIPKSVDADHPFRKKFRRNATKLFLPPIFPDQRVDIAYLDPEVDSDPSPFQWGVPDLDALRSFLMATIGWSQERTDEVLVPVIKDMNRRADEGTQANITAFFEGGTGAGAFAPRKRLEGSKRMGSALNKMAQRAKLNRNSTADEPADEAEGVSGGHDGKPATNGRAKTTRKRKANRAASPVASDSEVDEEFEEPTKKSRKRAGTGKSARKPRGKVVT